MVQKRPNMTPTQASGKMAFTAVSQAITRAKDMIPAEKQTELLRTAANEIRIAVEKDDISAIEAAKKSTIQAIFQELKKTT